MSIYTKLLIVLIIFSLLLSTVLYLLPSTFADSLPLLLKMTYKTLHGNFADGVLTGKINNTDFSSLQIGDIIIVGNPKSCYGKYTHVAIYVGNNMAVDGNIGEGIRYTSVDKYRIYAYAKILRARAPLKVRLSAANFAQKNIGKVFFLLSPRGNSNLTYCGKMVWEAYKKAGLDLLPEKYKDCQIVLPDYFLQSSLLFEVK